MPKEGEAMSFELEDIGIILNGCLWDDSSEDYEPDDDWDEII